jgi:hypothetical protein
MSSPQQEQHEEEEEGVEEIGILEESGLNEEQRREIRRQQRDLLKELEEADNLEVEDARDRNNEIYKNVRFTREAVLDGENLTLIANKAAQQVDRLIQVSNAKQSTHFIHCIAFYRFIVPFSLQVSLTIQLFLSAIIKIRSLVTMPIAWSANSFKNADRHHPVAAAPFLTGKPLASRPASALIAFLPVSAF